ncbi:hypothetical protein ACFQ8E_07845 [Isoptericola sp. NPDC056573]|uniref:hypothetical protein n=1 Tax=Isoptericola sp. NPDC056573 TaxID=3345868 RepID=UPI0036BAF0F2
MSAKKTIRGWFQRRSKAKLPPLERPRDLPPRRPDAKAPHDAEPFPLGGDHALGMRGDGSPY